MTRSELIHGVLSRLETLGLDYMVGGSFASSAWGNPRQTNDLDLVVDLKPDHVERFIAAFQDEFMLSESEIREVVTSNRGFRSLQLLHERELFKIDVFILEHKPFDQAAFARRVRRRFFEGIVAPIYSKEDTVLRKLQWYALANRASDRQWNDVVSILESQQGALELDYLDHWAEELGVASLLQEALGESRNPDPPG